MCSLKNERSEFVTISRLEGGNYGIDFSCIASIESAGIVEKNTFIYMYVSISLFTKKKMSSLKNELSQI